MCTFVIHAPIYQVQLNGKRSFLETLQTGVGRGYALDNTILPHITIGMKVVVLCKKNREQAEGQLDKLVTTGVFVRNNTMQRYDVYINNLQSVPFTLGNTPLNLAGVAIIPCGCDAIESDLD